MTSRRGHLVDGNGNTAEGLRDNHMLSAMKGLWTAMEWQTARAWYVTGFSVRVRSYVDIIVVLRRFNRGSEEDEVAFIQCNNVLEMFRALRDGYYTAKWSKDKYA